VGLELWRRFLGCGLRRYFRVFRGSRVDDEIGLFGEGCGFGWWFVMIEIYIGIFRVFGWFIFGLV
jgi:hypothetical protein